MSLNWDSEVEGLFKGKIEEEVRPASANAKSIVNKHDNANDLNMLAPFKYEWAWKMYLDANANHWLPTSIQMADDIITYRQILTEDEKHVFINVFAYLTTSDMVIQRNLALAVYEQLGAPELQCYLARQIYEESLHSWSYQYVIENLNLDQEEVYTRYKRIPEIKQKIQMCEDYTKNMCNGDLEDFLYGLIFYYLGFEGCWFFHGFTPIFSLGLRGLMKSTCEQLSYILRDESLHCAFGVRLIKEFLLETKIKLDVDRVYEIFKAVLNAEEIYMSYIMRNPILGYSKEAHMEHFAFILNRRANQIGAGKPFTGVNCRFDWLDTISGGMKQEKSFFERHVLEYSTGKLTW